MGRDAASEFIDPPIARQAARSQERRTRISRSLSPGVVGASSGDGEELG
jgi:hypothetical protein